MSKGIGLPLPKPVRFKKHDIEGIYTHIKCPFCNTLIELIVELEKCKVIFNPEIQKYEVIMQIVHCVNCNKHIKNITLRISRKKGTWSVS